MATKAASDKFLAIRVDKASPNPAYVQIADAIKAMLREGALPIGTLLPPERVLGERFGISRMTLRQAYDVLERENLIESHRGRGTFVSPKRMQKQQQEMRSFTEEILARGLTPSSELIAFRTIRQESADRAFFELPANELLYEIERVRSADGTPVALELVHVPQYLCPNLDRFNLGSQSLYQILEENYGLTLSYCSENISATLPTRKQRKLLQISGPTALLTLNRRTYTDKDTPAEIGTTTYRGDLYTAVIRSVRRKKK